MTYRLSLAVAAALSAISVPAAAHPDHASCGGGAPGVVEAFELPIGPGPDFGTGFVRPIAKARTAKQTIETLHDAYCADEPGDQPPLRPQTNVQPNTQSKK